MLTPTTPDGPQLVAAEGQSRARIERRIATLESQIDRLVAFIADGIGDTAEIGQEYADRCAELTEARPTSQPSRRA